MAESDRRALLRRQLTGVVLGAAAFAAVLLLPSTVDLTLIHLVGLTLAWLAPRLRARKRTER